MNENNRDIDIDFLNRLLYHREELTETEIEEWLSVEDNRKLLDEAAVLNRTLNPFTDKAAKERERIRLMSKILRPKRQLFRWVGYAASVLIIASAGLLLYMKDSGENTDQLLTQEKINPGEFKAELILPDGKSVLLAAKEKFVDKSESVIVQNDETNGLVYSKNEAEAAVQQKVYHTLKVPLGGYYPLLLSDGTKVWLNAGSELKYPVEFSGDVRDVYLHGEAYFEVKKDKIPFVVNLEDSRIEVLGTSFNVNAYKGDENIFATLRSGSIAFYSDKVKGRTVIKPGQQLKMDAGSGQTSVREVDASVYTSWTEGVFNFNDMSLDEIMKIVARWYQVDVVFENERIRHDQYFGKMPMYSDIEDVLRKIELSGNVKYKLEGKMLTISESKNGIN
jgi:ferric-dicitrate binding protein FerR (iron transport regulator)